MSTKSDVYQQVTSQIIAAIESGMKGGGLPWHRVAGGLPVNVLTGKHYNGINTVALWAMELDKGYTSSVWGTYKQWQEKGAQVKKGEKSSLIVFYKPLEIEDEETGEIKEIPMAKVSYVFNAAQVDGYTIPQPESQPIDALHNVDGFIANTAAIIEHTGQTACYLPSKDKILMPEKNLFIGTENETATAGYYAVLMHELTHWTGAESRCNRVLTGKMDTENYAIEELIAELGAAFLCAEFGIGCGNRADHAGYIASWLDALKNDNKFIFQAAAQARKAVEHLKSYQSTETAGEAA